ncbi:hypothetical protein VNO77_42186 [Canavalia gladiata]|uniref:Uncharacterized protein n=1 Tax=Canavalia gladiata TaxID=3824 RepID=A0AAN9PT60_CANGL
MVITGIRHLPSSPFIPSPPLVVIASTRYLSSPFCCYFSVAVTAISPSSIGRHFPFCYSFFPNNVSRHVCLRKKNTQPQALFSPKARLLCSIQIEIRKQRKAKRAGPN